MKKFYAFEKLLLGLGICASLNMQGQGSHVFPTFTNVIPEGSPMTFRGNGVWGDYNNDGLMDLVYVGRDIADGWNTHIVKLTNNGEGFDKSEDFGLPASGLYNAIVSWIDYNNDGNLDLLYIGTSNSETSNAAADVFAYLYKNLGSTGDYAFDQVTETGLKGYYIDQEGNYGSVVSIGDYNNDGFADILVTGVIDGVRYVDLYKNNSGDGTFALQEKMVDGFFNFDGMSSGSVAFGDMDSDGKLDVLSTGWNDVEGDAFIKMYRNIGDGAFEDTYIEDTAKGTQKGQIAWIDVNNDGNQDFIVTGERMEGGWPKMVDIYVNDGSGSFTKKTDAEMFIDPLKNSGIDYADIDNDGMQDLVMAGEGNEQHTWVYLNNGDFTYDAELNSLGKVRSGAIVTLADFNNDGFLDGFSCGYGNDAAEGSSDGSIAMVWENNGEGTANTAPGAPSNLNATYEDGKLTLTWNAGTDTETPVAALKYNVFVKKSGEQTLMCIPADTTSGFLRIPDLTNAIVPTTYSLEIADGVYQWGVQTIDQGKKGSVFAKAVYSGNDTTIIDTTSSVNDVYNSSKIRAYNVNGNVYVSLDDQTAVVSVFDLSGSLIAKEMKNENGIIGNISKSGVYIVKIDTGKEVKSFKVVLY